jgi:hypothetical protein
MKKKILIGLGIILAAALIGFITLKIMTKNAERNVGTEKAIILTPIEFATTYKNFEDSANKLYLNKNIQITGIISSISENQNNQMDAVIVTSDNLPAINCTIDGLYKSINTGDTIMLKGICTGILSNINLIKCIVVDSKKYTGKIGSTKTDSSVIKQTDTTKIKKIENQKINTTTSYNTSKAQIKFTGDGGIGSDIAATNNQAEASLTTDGIIKFKLAMLGFTFADALMQQHFNDEYVESKKFPTASFSGTITNLNQINFEKDGTYKATITGSLTIHGITQKITTPATITIQNKKLKAQSSIAIKMADYKISTDATSAATISINASF